MYNYEEEKPKIFSEDGMKTYVQMRDRAKALFKVSGAATVGKIMEGVHVGDSFQMIACIDYMVELGEIKYVSKDGWTQFHVVTEVRKY